MDAPVPHRGRLIALAALLALPLVGFVVLLGVPSTDVHWEHDPTHFWLVLGVALVNVGLGLFTSEAARQRDDARLFLVSLALLVSSGFLALHALATPGVVVEDKNAGFVIATPVGLLLASVFAAWSALDLEERSDALRRWHGPLRAGVAILLIAWAVASVAGLPILDRAPDAERAVWVIVLVPFAAAAYAFAALRYVQLYLVRRRVLPLAIAVAFVLLAEALVAVAFSRAWHASWWEWHILMAIAFGTILLAARTEYRRERSLTEAFGGMYLERTLERVDRRQSAALGELAAAVGGNGSVAEVAEGLRDEGFTSEEVAVLERSAQELFRVDELLQRYVGPRLAEGLRAEPSLSDLGGRELEVTALFADLVGFTTFSEGRPAADVVTMLNTYWQAIVPAVVDLEGGWIERFAGDAILTLFNVFDDQPDHAMRAVRAAVAVRDRSDELRAGREDWPRFRVGVNSGPVVVGNVGAGTHRTFSAIGDTTNVAARLQTLARPGEIVIGPTTFELVRETVETERLGAVSLKGREEPVEAHRVVQPHEG